MPDALQRAITFFIVMLPLTFAEAKRYWWFIIIWILFLVWLNYVIFSSVADQFEALKNQ
jgi:fatty acid desaturase